MVWIYANYPFLRLLLQILVLIPFSLCQSLVDDTLPASLQIIFLCHPFNKANVLPFTLGGIESQDYPKERVNVYLRSEVFRSVHDGSFNRSVAKYRNNQLTMEILTKWVDLNRDRYHAVDLQISEVNDEDAEIESTSYWTDERFNKIVSYKRYGLKYASNRWADFVLFVDADVVLTNPDTFGAMLNHNHTVVAPMLYSLGTYSNFWAGMTERGYYKRTDDYLPILERQKEGEFEVPMVHSCVFINLRRRKSNLLTFDATQLDNVPYDDIIAFAISAKVNDVPLVINNREVWGYILPPIENFEMEEINQGVTDLELESLVEGSAFPVATGFSGYVKRPEKDKVSMDNVYVINLERRPDRLTRMETCLNILGIEAEIWPAVDGKKLTEQYLRELGVTIMPGYLDPFHKRPMTFGEIGCFLSHYFIWQDMVKRNYSRAIILEDDVRFEHKFKQRLLKAMSVVSGQEDIDFVYLGRKRQGEVKDEYIVTRGFVKPTYSYWTIGYYLTLNGAIKLLQAKPLEKLLPVDEFFPIMYNKHPCEEWSRHYRIRNLNALSVEPLLIAPTHYVGDALYVSDTEDSSHVMDHDYHPKHTEL